MKSCIGSKGHVLIGFKKVTKIQVFPLLYGSKKCMNKVKSFDRGDGQFMSDEGVVKNIVKNYFMDLFTS